MSSTEKESLDTGERFWRFALASILSIKEANIDNIGNIFHLHFSF